MPRSARRIAANECYHVLTRANEGATVFRDEEDLAQFMTLFDAACRRFAMRILAYCLMPTHFHVVVKPSGGAQLAKWMHWLLTTHAHRHRVRHGGSGHVWQGRYKSFVVQDSAYLLTVLAYVERNAVRGGHVARAEDWPWGSARWLGAEWRPSWLMTHPAASPQHWLEQLRHRETDRQLKRLRHHAASGLPLGDAPWRERVARELGIRATAGKRGRPRKKQA